MQRSSWRRASVCAAAAVVGIAGLTAGLGAGGQPEKAAVADLTKSEDCKQVVLELRELRDRVRAADEKLDKKLNAMQGAEGDEKVKLLAEVVSDMALQRREAMDAMGQIHDRMMGHMASHLAGGSGAGLGACPMMKSMSQGAAGARPK